MTLALIRYEFIHALFHVLFLMQPHRSSARPSEALHTSASPKPNLPSFQPLNYFGEIRKASAQAKTQNRALSDNRSGRKNVNDDGYRIATRRLETPMAQSTTSFASLEVTIRLFTANRGTTPTHLPPDQKFFWNPTQVVHHYSDWLMELFHHSNSSPGHRAWRERQREMKLDTDPLSDDPDGVRTISISSLYKDHLTGARNKVVIPIDMTPILPATPCTIGSIFAVLKRNAAKWHESSTTVSAGKNNKSSTILPMTDSSVVIVLTVPTYWDFSNEETANHSPYSLNRRSQSCVPPTKPPLRSISSSQQPSVLPFPASEACEIKTEDPLSSISSEDSEEIEETQKSQRASSTFSIQSEAQTPQPPQSPVSSNKTPKPPARAHKTPKAPARSDKTPNPPAHSNKTAKPPNLNRSAKTPKPPTRSDKTPKPPACSDKTSEPGESSEKHTKETQETPVDATAQATTSRSVSRAESYHLQSPEPLHYSFGEESMGPPSYIPPRFTPSHPLADNSEEKDGSDQDVSYMEVTKGNKRNSRRMSPDEKTENAAWKDRNPKDSKKK
ncbi:hypothetical protein BJ508DRAFT_303943 [Ascobolus immersus RN42]|uniref:Uncharacterized protein n=1 Tax=Ascobolus immersus RN42 TaxID=1160509 RepID=A0A3N4IIZ1_ASCIM|nr:hypothetical protein BJ508DRAFT_303943 [Ascobolus immersus RN42]